MQHRNPIPENNPRHPHVARGVRTGRIAPRYAAVLGLVAVFAGGSAMADDTMALSDRGLLRAFEQAPDMAAVKNVDVVFDEGGSARIESSFGYVMAGELLADDLQPLPQPRVDALHPARRRVDAGGRHVDVDAAWNLRVASDAPRRDRLDAQLRHAFAAGMARIQSCWERALLQAGKHSGQITLALTLSPEGRVASVHKIQDDIQHAELDKCVMTMARRVKTAQAVGQQVFVEMPLQFASARQ